MTQVHIALFKWKDSVTEAEIDQVLKDLSAQAVPGSVEIWAGKNESRFSQGYTHVALIRGTSAEAIEAYRTHPDHVALGQTMHAMQAGGVGADFVQD
jgi:hypothetical protein